MKTIDWKSMAEEVGALAAGQELGGTDVARRALAKLLGNAVFVSAVDHYVVGAMGGETARSVLSLVRPASAVDRCIEIEAQSGDLAERRAAVELLRVLPSPCLNAHVLGWIEDPDVEIQSWAARLAVVLDDHEMLEPSSRQRLLELAHRHLNEDVRETLTNITAR